ncbi:MAG: MFS transporter [Oscillospiraceae bacterium]|nr:MFS transporter [Oscillospiraceae bacterium]
MSNTKVTKNNATACIIVLLLANTIASGAEWTSTVLQTISDAFPDAPYSVITLVNNAPNLCAVFLCLFAGLTVNRLIPLKGFMLVAMAFHFIGGSLPAFLGNSLYSLLFGRCLFGVGYGIMQGLSISMVYKLVTNEKTRIHAMGWTQSAQYGINIVAQLLVGYLALISWNAAFFAYLWGVIPFIVVAIFCPKFPLDKNDPDLIAQSGSAEARESIGTTLKSFPAVVWIFSVFMAMYFVHFYIMIVNASPIIVGRGYGDSVSAGYAMTVFGIGTIVGGLLFGFIAKATKQWLHLIVCLIMASALLILNFATTYAMVVVALAVGSLGTMMIPATMSAYTPYIPAHRVYLATAITMACVNSGAFLSTPYIYLFELQGLTSTDAFVPSAIILVVMGILSVFFNNYAAKHYPVVNIDK